MLVIVYTFLDISISSTAENCGTDGSDNGSRIFISSIQIRRIQNQNKTKKINISPYTKATKGIAVHPSVKCAGLQKSPENKSHSIAGLFHKLLRGEEGSLVVLSFQKVITVIIM